MARTKGTIHYVDNKRFNEVMVDYIAKYKVWAAAVKVKLDAHIEENNLKLKKKQLKQLRLEFEKLEQDTKPPIPDYAAESVIKIANRLATKPNFARYEYKQEMIDDGIINCIQYMHDFDPEKSSNPFSYFTQFIYFAFLRRIEKQNKERDGMQEYHSQQLAEYAVQSPHEFPMGVEVNHD